jgi:hypothetical protein
VADSASNDTSPQRAPAWRRYLLIALPIVAVVCVLVLLFYDRIRIQGYINRLNSSDPTIRREQMDALEGHDDRELVNEMLADAVAEDDSTFSLRITCANLLMRFQRMAMLEKLFDDTGSVRTRGVVLKVFAHQQWFGKFVEERQGRVEQTVRDWLARADDPTRSHAIQLAVRLEFDWAMELIAPFLAEAPPANLHPDAKEELLIAAAGAAERFKHCESVPAVVRLTRSSELYLVRMRMLQILDRLAWRKQPPAACPGAVDEETMRQALSAALDEDRHENRMAAMLIIARHAAWAEEFSPRIGALLDRPGGPPAERRQALETLVALRQPAFLERFPVYFHDPEPGVRSSCVRVAPSVKEPPVVGCFIGLVHEEVEHQIWSSALDALHQRAGRWVGLPQKYAIMESPKRSQALHTLFARGELDGVTRWQVSEAWFRWWCDQLSLDEEATDKAVAARKVFFEAKDRDDVAAAEAALATVDFDVAGLFTYERAWLLAESDG